MQNFKLLFPKVYEEIVKKIHYMTLTKPVQGHTKYQPVPSTSCDLRIYKVQGCYREDSISRNVTDRQTDVHTYRQTDVRRTDRLWYEINMSDFSNEKAGIITQMLK